MTKLVIVKLITYYSLIYGISPNVAISVCQVESNFNPNAIGITNDLGLFQLKPSSFPRYSKKQLLNPELNIKLGVKYLAKMKKECKYKDNEEYLVCYNYGLKNANRVKHADLWPYTKRVKLAMGDL